MLDQQTLRKIEDVVEQLGEGTAAQEMVAMIALPLATLPPAREAVMEAIADLPLAKQGLPAVLGVVRSSPRVVVDPDAFGHLLPRHRPVRLYLADAPPPRDRTARPVHLKTHRVALVARV